MYNDDGLLLSTYTSSSINPFNYTRDDLMQFENKVFITALLDFMKMHNLFTGDVLDILQSKEKCAEKFNHNSLNGILLKKQDEIKAEEQIKDQSGNARYYSDEYSICDNTYFVSSEWRPDREDARGKIIDWAFSLANKIRIKTDQIYGNCSYNRIIFGAPGTGKSFTLNKDKKDLLANGGDYERVTFHPDYSYANFVGTYKPVPDKDNSKDITYEYVPGPFMRVLVKALESGRTLSPKPYLLIIEEINRANTAAVFGDVFQLLDREDNVSEYPIQTSQDMRKYLADKLGGSPDEYKEIRIPDNMFIWATMNSADQGVYPMDTAFKRRWDFEYIGINEGEKDMYSFDFKYCLGQNTNKKYNYRDDKISWNSLRKAINEVLGDEYHLNEDKLLGPFFISMNTITQAITQNDDDLFWRTFDNKVLMYLCDDAMRHRSNYEKLFTLEKQNQPLSYALIHNEFKKKGLDIFSQKITEAVKKFAKEDVKNYEEQTADEVNDEA